MRRDAVFWMIQGPGWLLFVYLVYAQAIPAFDYELGVNLGTQEPEETITAVGAAFWYGFALGDLLIYLPLLGLGLTGYWIALPLIALWAGWGLWQLVQTAGRG
jgi:hypothetical protein